ncbi:hypothetical protein LINPERHAP1_LOCUS31467, partial [Linum perenne]
PNLITNQPPPTTSNQGESATTKQHLPPPADGREDVGGDELRLSLRRVVMASRSDGCPTNMQDIGPEEGR